MTTIHPLKLQIELVPKTAWYSNLRNNMSKAKWDKLRFQIYGDYDHLCGICDVHPKVLHCHEIWEYDDQKHIQLLKGFVALCVLCHHVKHIGLAGILADQGKPNMDEVIAHFVLVNGCSRQTFYDHRDHAFSIWRQWSLYEWKTDLGEYTKLVEGEVK